MKSKEALITYDERKAEYNVSVLFIIDDEEVWIPKSQIIDEFPEDNQVVIPEWLAVKKDLI